MKRFVATLAGLLVLTIALTTPALAIGTWPTPESPVAAVQSPGSTVMIGTWPTPELPFPYWSPIVWFPFWW